MQLPFVEPDLPRLHLSTSRTQRAVHHVAGIFAGIGGLEEGFRQAGHEATVLCEIDASARTVLSAKFPTIIQHDDVRTLHDLPSPTTILAAGFPCQDLSQAGQTIGISGNRSGLVDEVFRLISCNRVPWVVLENVPFMLQLGRGEAMEHIVSEFERLDYKWAYRIVNSTSFGLPQRRRRVYFVASKRHDPRTILFADEFGEPISTKQSKAQVAHGFYWTEGVRGLGWAVDAVPTIKGGSGLGIPSSPAVVFSDGRVGTIDIRDAERLQGFPADWTIESEKISKRGTRWKLIGNAITVHAARWLGDRFANPGQPLVFGTHPLLRGAKWPTAAWNVGDGRVKVVASEWPVQLERASLEQFLSFPSPALSARATSGFLKRTERAKLRFPEGFIATLRAHLDVVQR